ncbi:hypothetical protein [Streptomyces sp. SM11]|uniref:hypothetical protein n=1 Tax=Streptomyces sp. SM11 TaxID=565557 RepID=UPI000CD53268|nr:hypothetical protein [Streptomyces sp. SM11]
MVAMWTSVVAVGGTLMGAVITHLFQRLAATRSERFARSEALRQERTAVYGSFAAAVEDYRHGQAGRWYRMREGRAAEAYIGARDEAHRLRTATRHVLYRVKLLTDDQEVILAAEQAYRCTRDVSTAQDQAGHDALDAAARQAIEEFIPRAAPLTR